MGTLPVRVGRSSRGEKWGGRGGARMTKRKRVEEAAGGGQRVGFLR